VLHLGAHPGCNVILPALGADASLHKRLRSTELFASVRLKSDTGERFPF
jgi:hypothetical protein